MIVVAFFAGLFIGEFVAIFSVALFRAVDDDQENGR